MSYLSIQDVGGSGPADESPYPIRDGRCQSCRFQESGDYTCHDDPHEGCSPKVATLNGLSRHDDSKLEYPHFTIRLACKTCFDVLRYRLAFIDSAVTVREIVFERLHPAAWNEGH